MEQLLIMKCINDRLHQLMIKLLFIKYFFATNDSTETEILFAIVTIFNNLEHVKMGGYCDWINSYLNYDFFSLFRMTKETFAILVQKLNCEERYFRGGHLPLSTEKQLLMTLWWLGKGEVLLSVADRFAVSVSTVYKSTEYILSRIINLQNQYIVWPNINEAISIEESFQAKARYPGVIGAIDVCNIPFKAPKNQQDSYIDRKLQHSIKLQAICTPSKMFINTMVGFPGSVHDSRVLRNSTLYVAAEINRNVQHYFHNDQYHLVGDSAYPLLNWLMTPYRDNGHLTAIQRRHNESLSSTRVVIEHTFGIVKSRWRILNYVNVNSVIKTVRIITACCILHNFCYVNLDFWNNYVPVNDDGDDIIDRDDVNENAADKRDNIANNLLFH